MLGNSERQNHIAELHAVVKDNGCDSKHREMCLQELVCIVSTYTKEELVESLNETCVRELVELLTEAVNSMQQLSATMRFTLCEILRKKPIQKILTETTDEEIEIIVEYAEQQSVQEMKAQERWKKLNTPRDVELLHEILQKGTRAEEMISSLSRGKQIVFFNTEYDPVVSADVDFERTLRYMSAAGVDTVFIPAIAENVYSVPATPLCKRCEDLENMHQLQIQIERIKKSFHAVELVIPDYYVQPGKATFNATIEQMQESLERNPQSCFAFSNGILNPFGFSTGIDDGVCVDDYWKYFSLRKGLEERGILPERMCSIAAFSLQELTTIHVDDRDQALPHDMGLDFRSGEFSALRNVVTVRDGLKLVLYDGVIAVQRSGRQPRGNFIMRDNGHPPSNANEIISTNILV